MGLKIILFVYFWLYCCITNLNLWKKIFLTNNYLLLLNETLLNFAVRRNTKLEGSISGPPFHRLSSGPVRVRRFITGLALDRLPYQGHIFPDQGPIGVPPKFLHRGLSKKSNFSVFFANHIFLSVLNNKRFASHINYLTN